MSTTADNTIPAEIRLPLYLSTRYLQELALALRLVGVRVRYERPGAGGIMLPRLAVGHPEHGEQSWTICAIPQRVDDRNHAWWFEWRSFAASPCPYGAQHERKLICQALDMNKAARTIAAQLYGGTT